MFIDFLALALLVLVIGLAMVALYFAHYINNKPKNVAPGMLLAGFIGFVLGLYIIFTWPLPSSYNIAFGEPLVLFGALLFGTGLAIIREWDLVSLGVFAFLAGIVAIIVGVRLINLQMTKEPLISGLGYIFTGLSGVLYLPAYLTRERPLLRYHPR